MLGRKYSYIVQEKKEKMRNVKDVEIASQVEEARKRQIELEASCKVNLNDNGS